MKYISIPVSNHAIHRFDYIECSNGDFADILSGDDNRKNYVCLELVRGLLMLLAIIL
ncbi:hypothetical protein ODQ07_004205 [Escherichia albertii]|nr:hypothetical protein [Escherichia albertii]